MFLFTGKYFVAFGNDFCKLFLVNIFILVVLSQALEAYYWVQYEPLQTCSMTLLQPFIDHGINYYKIDIDFNTNHYKLVY